MSRTQQLPLAAIGDLCRRFNRPPHALRFAIDSRGIKSAGRVGTGHVYDVEGQKLIAKALREIEANKRAKARRGRRARLVGAAAE